MVNAAVLLGRIAVWNSASHPVGDESSLPHLMVLSIKFEQFWEYDPNPESDFML
jgi:hypothetical protein